ncbi:MAG: hypothetical protein ACK4PI_01495 [Tepidisphaerales bacterium]
MRQCVFGSVSASLLAAVWAVSGGSASAAVYEYPIVIPGNLTTTATTLSVDTTGATGRARAFYITGDWLAISTNDPWSNELRAQLVGLTNVGGGALDRPVGGLANSNPFTFTAPAATTWANNTTSPLGRGAATYLADVPAADMGGIFTLGLRQTFAGSVTSLTNASIGFVTDIITPVPVSTVGGPTMVQRPTSLTALTTNGPYRYAAVTVTAIVSGPHHFGVYTGGADGFLYVYRGSFDPTAPLVNLAGLDDVGDLGDTNSSSLWLDMTAGETAVAVITTFNPTANVSQGLFTWAGPIPEPAALGVLAPVAALLLRRRA